MKFLKKHTILVLKLVAVLFVTIALLLGFGSPVVESEVASFFGATNETTFFKIAFGSADNVLKTGIAPSWAGILAIVTALLGVVLLFIPVKKNILSIVASVLFVVSAILLFTINKTVYVKLLNKVAVAEGIKLATFAIVIGVFYLLAAVTSVVVALRKK